jgi:hypothetical protein
MGFHANHNRRPAPGLPSADTMPRRVGRKRIAVSRALTLHQRSL